MTEHEIAATLVIALGAHADQVMADATSLVSVTIEMLAPGEPGTTRTTLTRKTRTLAFINAEYVNGAGVRIATAASVHKITPR